MSGQVSYRVFHEVFDFGGPVCFDFSILFYILRLMDYGFLLMTLFASFTFLADTSVSILHHPASICSISFATPIGACIIVRSALLLTTSAFLMIFSSYFPEVTSSPYR